MKKRSSSPLAMLALLCCIAVFSACDKTEDVVIDYKHNYYPTLQGHYVVYDVDSIVIDDEFSENRSDTFRFQRKYVIDSSFTDGAGREAVALVRYYRPDSTHGWTLTDVWSAVITNNGLEISEENQRFLKLLFPPREAQTWNGNKYIDSLAGNWWYWIPSGWEYIATEVDLPATVNSMEFDSTVTVWQQSDSTKIHMVTAVEKYAKNVGMIYKQFTALEKNGDINRPWSDPESGLILTMTINNYGN